MGERLVVARYSKAKAKDLTDSRRHGYKARGGPITRIFPKKPAGNED